MMSLRRYARRRGVSANAVSKAVAVGRLRESIAIVKGQPKIVDPAVADAEWLANTRPRADHPRTRRAAPTASVVYFIRCDSGPIGQIKIGSACDILERLQALQCGCPFRLHVIATVAGGYELEGELHRRLSAHRGIGEWFADTPEVRAAMAEIGAR